MRLSYPKSCARLSIYLNGKIPPMPSRQPRHDDDELGVSFFRTRVEGDLSNLTIPRTFFGRSEIIEASFCGTDLTESTPIFAAPTCGAPRSRTARSPRPSCAAHSSSANAERPWR
jgi:hypothetical protein